MSINDISYTHKNTEKSYKRALIVCLAVLLSARLVALYFSKTNLFFDEAQYWSWSQDLDFGYFSKPPMLAWIIRAGTGLCGLDEFCVRYTSPVLHTFTALFIFLIGRTLYDDRTGFWSAIVFAILPGISFSSTLVSTDVPLLFFWSVALFSWIKLLQTRAWIWTFLLGVSLGLGIMSKYAMIYFLACALVYLFYEKEHRWMLQGMRGLLTAVIVLALMTPNIIWNLENGLVTFSHTAANANWDKSLFHPLKALEFFAAQFGVFGPILFAAFLVILWRSFYEGLRRQDFILVCFALPIIILITVQAFLSRAHANWAAVAYPAAAILVTSTMLRDNAKSWFRASMVLHIFLMLVLSLGLSMAGRMSFPFGMDPYARVLGWDRLAEITKTKLAEGNFSLVLTDDRAVSAELLYYLRDTNIQIKSWRPEKVPHDHFQLTRAFTGKNADGRILYVGLRKSADHIIHRFEQSIKLDQIEIATGKTEKRSTFFYALSGFKGY